MVVNYPFLGQYNLELRKINILSVFLCMCVYVCTWALVDAQHTREVVR